MRKRITGFVGSLVLASSALSLAMIPEVNAGTWRCCKNLQSCRPNQVREKEKAKGLKIFTCKHACRCREKTAAEQAAEKKEAAKNKQGGGIINKKQKKQEERKEKKQDRKNDRDRGNDSDNKRR
tara:strand:- start:85 stop:456 length:372 start_codon:yes stop_codon:yes gene_type:complete